MVGSQNHGLFSKIKRWVAGDPFEDELYEAMDEDSFEQEKRYKPMMDNDMDAPKRARNLKVVEHPQSQQGMEVVVIEPRAFEESLALIEHLRVRKSIILNLHLLDTAQSQRVVDFLSGATHAIRGNQHRIGDGVFLFTPSHVNITAETVGKEESTFNFTDAFWTNSSRGR